MARKITRDTKLRRGTIVRVFGKVLGIVVRHETFLGHPGYYAFNSSPGDEEFIEEYGVDWYTRRHINDLARDKAEIITRAELVAMHKAEPSSELNTLLEMTKRPKSTT